MNYELFLRSPSVKTSRGARRKLPAVDTPLSSRPEVATGCTARPLLGDNKNPRLGYSDVRGHYPTPPYTDKAGASVTPPLPANKLLPQYGTRHNRRLRVARDRCITA